MSVKIRLKRFGAKMRPFYRIVVMDSRKPRDGRTLEEIGTYHPIEVEAEAAHHRRGAGQRLALQGRSALGHGQGSAQQEGHSRKIAEEKPVERDLVEYIAKSLVDDPAAVYVAVVEGDKSTILELGWPQRTSER